MHAKNGKLLSIFHPLGHLVYNIVETYWNTDVLASVFLAMIT